MDDLKNTEEYGDNLTNCSPQPPYSNTGVVENNENETPQTITAYQIPMPEEQVWPAKAKMDWLTLTLWMPFENIQDAVLYRFQYEREDFSDSWAVDWRGQLRFAKIGEYGQLKEFNEQDGKLAPYVSLMLSGKACELLSHAGLWNLARELGYLGRVKCSRLDAAFDAVPFTVETFHQAVKTGQLVSRHYKADTVDWRENKEGKTCYLGNRKGAYFLRVYDRRGPVRMEFEIKDNSAEHLFDYLCMREPEKWSDSLASFMLRSLDFREPGRYNNRRKQVSWWENLLAGRTLEAVPKVPQKPKRKATFLGQFEMDFRRLAPRLEAYRQYVGDDRFAQMLKSLAGDNVPDHLNQFTADDFPGWPYGRLANQKIPF